MLCLLPYYLHTDDKLLERGWRKTRRGRWVPALSLKSTQMHLLYQQQCLSVCKAIILMILPFRIVQSKEPLFRTVNLVELAWVRERDKEREKERETNYKAIYTRDCSELPIHYLTLTINVQVIFLSLLGRWCDWDSEVNNSNFTRLGT